MPLRPNAKVGFSVLDAKGRISLPKPVREALGVGPGSSVAYVRVDNMLLLIPQLAVMTETPQLRLFLDSGVIIEGSTRPWGASKVVLILCTLRRRWRVVLAEAVEHEIRDALARKIATLPLQEGRDIALGLAGWFNRVRLERWPLLVGHAVGDHANNRCHGYP